MNYYPRAFPLAGSGIQGSDEKGMTLRDWFAGQALSETLARVMDSDSIYDSIPERVAYLSYQLADAMLAARKDA